LLADIFVSCFFKAERAYDFAYLLGVFMRFSVEEPLSLSVAKVDAKLF